ncbi:MAG: nucleotidyltransferase family protein [Victivallaceae bacterium]|nr:nucleotidyltransferase family protein [Victivallaceae bacterium]
MNQTVKKDLDHTQGTVVSDALSALSRWIFQQDPGNLTHRFLNELHLSALAAGILPDRLPEEIAVKAKMFFLKLQANDLVQEQTLLEIARLFTANQIPFCPIKGADLAPRVYPKSALRPRGDLDVLVPQEKQKYASQLLQKNGWKQPYRYKNPYHEADFFRNGICLELHHKLPGFPQKAMPEVWRNAVETTNEFPHLALEWNLLMLFQHSAMHQWHKAVTLLMDYGFLLQKADKIDWEKLRAVSGRWHLQYPALFFRAFPDFFPAKWMPEETFPQEICTDFRHMLLFPAKWQSNSENAMTDACRFSRQWWLDRFHGLRPSVIRYVTKNPRGHCGKLCLDYLKINGAKILFFIQGWRKICRKELPVSNPVQKKIQNFLILPSENKK